MKVSTIYTKSVLTPNFVANLCNLDQHKVATVKFVVGFPDHNNYVTGGGHFSINTLCDGLSMLFNGTALPSFAIVCISSEAAKLSNMPPCAIFRSNKDKKEIAGYIAAPVEVSEAGTKLLPTDDEVQMTNLIKVLEHLESVGDKKMIEMLFNLLHRSPVMYVADNHIYTCGPWQYTEVVSGEPVIYM